MHLYVFSIFSYCITLFYIHVNVLDIIIFFRKQMKIISIITLHFLHEYFLSSVSNFLSLCVLCHLLTISWPSPDHLLDIFWPSSGHLLTISWPSPGHLLVIFWPSSGHLLAIFWPSSGHLPAIS